MCIAPNLRFGDSPTSFYGGDLSGRQVGLQPGLSYQDWLSASGLDSETFGSMSGYRAYRALSGDPIAEGSEALPPKAPPGPPSFSLKIDSTKTGAGDLRIRT